MDIREEILKEHSKAQANKIVSWVGKDKKRFAQLMQLFLNDEYRVVQRLAQVVGIIGKNEPELVTPVLHELIDRMNEDGVHVAVKRNVVRLLQFVEIPESLHGEVMNTCFNLLADPKETVAVRCFSMTVLDNLSNIYPDIRQELLAIIQEQLQHETTAGFRSRAKQVLKQP